MTSELQIQLGKKGLSNEFLNEIKNRFEKQKLKNIKINVLKSARESRDDIKRYSEEILKFLGDKYTARTIGFSIFVMKWRKLQKSIS